MRIHSLGLCLISILLVFTACTGKKIEEKKTFTFTGETVALTKQNNSVIEGVNIDYTLQISDFNPTEEAFNKYIEQFGENGQYKHINITKKTKIFNKNEQLIKPQEIKMNQKIKFTVELINEYFVFAVEIKELQ